MNANPPSAPDTSAAAPETAEGARVRELLPWFARGALDADNHAFVQAWLAKQPELPPDIAADLEWWCSTEALLRDEVTARAADPAQAELANAGLARLMAQVSAKPGPASSPRPAAPHAQPVGAGIWQRLRQLLSSALAPRRPVLAFGVAALVLVQAVAISTLLLREPAEQIPLSGPIEVPVAADLALFTLAFKSQATEQAVRELLAGVDAQIVSGPTALGLYRVAVPRAVAARALAAFSTASTVVDAVQRDR